MNLFGRTRKSLREFIGRPTEELGRWSRFAVFQLKVWPKCIQLLQRNRAGEQAAALSYHTIFGIVPLAIVVLMVFQAIPASKGIGDEVRRFVYEQANLTDIELQIGEDQEIRLTDKMNEMTESFVASLNKGLVTLFSGVIVVWAALALLITIEKSFNNIWHITKGRNFINRIINYWALLTLGPLLLGLTIYAATQFFFLNKMDSQVIEYLQPVIGYFISLVALFFLYYMMPNTKVSPRAALWGAAVASLLWSLAKFGFGIYVTRAVPYAKVYGVMGLIPLGVLWVWITWIIVLFGLQLTYTTQHLKKLSREELSEVQKGSDYFMVNDFAIIRILEFILEQFERRKAPVSAQVVCSNLKLPREFGEQVLDHLVDQKLLHKISEPDDGYAPATDGSHITLEQIAQAAVQGSFVQREIDKPGKLKQIIDQYHHQLARHTLKDVLDLDEQSLGLHKLDDVEPPLIDPDPDESDQNSAS